MTTRGVYSSGSDDDQKCGMIRIKSMDGFSKRSCCDMSNFRVIWSFCGGKRMAEIDNTRG
ncbi:hypothetical protein HNQ69_000389 [Bartonella callosciuri]|uniref:Uncharacterized protein n=1 Tax=Bartonella callosciuri TaxID=686223 RepID=A0A840NTK5_9HYPH|nr:hypothetical protein [Bartonella callosciuri]MBB5073285.1 hypothetical protein [Bartonella callosciuri]